MFDKNEYWKRRNNVEKKEVPDGDKKKRNGEPKMKKVEVAKPLRGQGDELGPVSTKPSDVTIGFDMQGRMIVQNRAYRRTHTKLPNNEYPKIPLRKRFKQRNKQAQRVRALERKIKLAKV